MDPLDRLKKLIALASNPSTPEEEARTAAVLAVRTIASKGVVLSLPGRAAPPPGFPDPLSDFFEAVVNGDVRPRPRRSPPPPRPKEEEIPQRKIRAKYESRCGTCGSFVEVGSPIFWTQGRSPNCETCGPIRATGT